MRILRIIAMSSRAAEIDLWYREPPVTGRHGAKNDNITVIIQHTEEFIKMQFHFVTLANFMGRGDTV